MDPLKTETITRENITIYKVGNFFCNCLVEGTVVPATLMAAFSLSMQRLCLNETGNGLTITTDHNSLQ